MADEDPFPVAEVEPEPEKKKRGSGLVKGSPEAKAWAADMQARRAAKSAGGGGPTRPTAPRSHKKKEPTSALAEVEDSLREGFRKVGAMMLVPAPVPGTYVLETGDDAAATITRVASHNPKVLEALQGTSNVMDFVAVGAWVGGLLVAFGVQAGRIYADAPVSRAFGIDRIADQYVMPEDPITDEPPEDAGPAFTIPTPPEPEPVEV